MIKKNILGLLFFGLVACSLAQMNVLVCDPNTHQPYLLGEIMVNETVSLLVQSDANGLWGGGLFISGQDRELAQLTARDKDPNSRDWRGSHLAAAGVQAFVTEWEDSNLQGFDLYTDDIERQPGDWFIIDYTALEPGTCNVGFYDYDYSWTDPDPNIVIELINLRTRDFQSDSLVTMKDFTVLARNWLGNTCVDPTWCEQTDLDQDGFVGLTDLALFSEYWLWGTPDWKPAIYTDPNIYYSIVDDLGQDEITAEVNQSITLYVDMETLQEDVMLFDLEVNMSDPNMGWIDNTPYDPNNPPGLGTARIMASPRTEMFDYWGPGLKQARGIEFSAASISGSMEDGHLASFEYTPQVLGDVELRLVDYSLLPAAKRSILIHQVDSPQMMGDGGDSDSSTQGSQDSTGQMVERLNEIWQEESTQQVIDETQWNQMIESIQQENSSDTQNQ